HPAVMECAAIGVPDAYHGEVVKACVVLKPGHTATADELKAHCKTRLTEYKRPRIIDIRESLPKSAVGKILYTKLRAEAAAPHVGAISTVAGVARAPPRVLRASCHPERSAVPRADQPPTL